MLLRRPVPRKDVRRGSVALPGASQRVSRVEEAAQVAFSDVGKPRRDVEQLAGAHPAFELVDQTEQVIEAIDYEQDRLVVVDLRHLIDDPLELDRVPLRLAALDGVLELAVGAEQSAAVAQMPFGPRPRISPNSTVNQKKRDMARIRLVSRRTRSP